MAVVARAALVLAVLPLLAGVRVSSGIQPPSDLDAFAKKVREVIRREYAEPVYFNYIEQGRDVDISMLGKVSVGPMQTFEVRQDPPRGAWRRLIAVDGKPLDSAELARASGGRLRLPWRCCSPSFTTLAPYRDNAADDRAQQDDNANLVGDGERNPRSSSLVVQVKIVFTEPASTEQQHEAPHTPGGDPFCSRHQFDLPPIM